MSIPFLPRKIGRCIYCLAKQYNPNDADAPFGEEHIIPRGLGGRRVLKEASCLKCEGITSQIETQCVDFMVSHGRTELGIFGRRTRSKTKSRHRAATPKKPSVIMTYRLISEPGLLTGAHGQAAPAAIAVVVGSRRTSGPLALTHFPFRHGGASTQIFSRLLAKIGHAYAVDVLGLYAFTPMLTSLILGTAPLHASLLVGGPLATDVGDIRRLATEPHTITHEWRPDADGQELFIVRIRLFANFNPVMPTNVVIAGRRPVVKAFDQVDTPNHG